MTELFNAPHRRYNPLNGEWVLVSSGRTGRPWQGAVERLPPEQLQPYDPNCYLCPGNTRARGLANPDYESTFVFTNDYSALFPDTTPGGFEKGLLRAESQRGTCRVLCFSPRHDQTLASLDAATVREVIDLWADQVTELGRTHRWVQIFENRGEMMGASNPHPHGQVWAGEALPIEPSRENQNQLRYYEEHRSPMLVDYARDEANGERVVVEDDDWLALVPFWAVWPFEVMIIPKARIGHLPDLDEPTRVSLAAVLKAVLASYDRLFESSVPYSMGWHGTPFSAEDQSHWQLHAHIYPPLLRSATIRKFMVGYELLAERQRDLTPEEAASRLRAFLPKLL